MAFTLAALTMANPTSVDIDGVPLVAVNVTYSGPSALYLTHDTAFNRGIHVLSFVWENLNATELANIRVAWQLTAASYQTLVFDDIALAAILAVTDETSVTVFPDSGLDVEFMQGWDLVANGPVMYQASASFVTQPEKLES